MSKLYEFFRCSNFGSVFQFGNFTVGYILDLELGPADILPLIQRIHYFD